MAAPGSRAGQGGAGPRHPLADPLPAAHPRRADPPSPPLGLPPAPGRSAPPTWPSPPACPCSRPHAPGQPATPGRAQHTPRAIVVITPTSKDKANTPRGAQLAPGGRGPTSLNAVYAPFPRHCTLATAGHPLPVLVTGGGAAQVASDHIGPLLGIGGMPFATTELDPAPGSILALFTDRLIESRHPDIDHGTARLIPPLA